jgi:hypothetical protein
MGGFVWQPSQSAGYFLIFSSIGVPPILDAGPTFLAAQIALWILTLNTFYRILFWRLLGLVLQYAEF